MTINDIITYIRDKRNSNLPEIKDAIALCNTVDYFIYNDIIKHYDTEIEYNEYTKATDEVLLGKEWIKIYVSYICAEMEKNRNAMKEYNNDIAVYNNGVIDFRNYYNRHKTNMQENSIKWL